MIEELGRRAKPYAAIADRLGPDLLRELRDTHDANQDDCCGYSEGQWCCIDYLTASITDAT